MIELLEGVELLSTTRTLSEGECILLLLVGIIAFGLSLWLFIVSICENSIPLTFCGLLLIGLCSWCTGLLFSEMVEPEIAYKVTVEDSVSMNEFYEKYEILDIDGKIYTIKERKVGDVQ